MAFQSFASERFWQLYSELPVEVQRLADKQYELFQENPFHPSLHLKHVGEVWTVRVGRSHRAIGYREGDVFRLGLDRFARSVQQDSAEDKVSATASIEQPQISSRRTRLCDFLG
jgi:hypothetical protein